MKLSKFASLVMIGLAVTFAASGCKKKPGSLTPLPNGKAGQVGDPYAAGKAAATPSGCWMFLRINTKIFPELPEVTRNHNQVGLDKSLQRKIKQ